MPSVTRDKRKYGAPTVGGATSANEERSRKEREEARGDEMLRERQRREGENQFYHVGRVFPITPEE